MKTEDHTQKVPNRVLIPRHGGTIVNWIQTRERIPKKCLPEETKPRLQTMFPAAGKNPRVYSVSSHQKVLTSILL